MKYTLFLLLLLSSLQPLMAQTDTIAIEKKLDLTYLKVGNWEGKLDFYTTAQKTKLPLVIYIHGGGWTHGKKEAEYDKFKVFIKNGFAVANVEYRLANQAPAPAAIEDVNTAIHYLISNAKALKINTSKIIVMGGSAGAHLALLAGLQAARPIYSDRSFKIAAIISKYGPTDLLRWKAATDTGSASSTWLADRKTDTTFIKTLSPFYSVSGPKLPVLFIHGDQDKTVPIEQSEWLHEKLKQKGFISKLYVVKNGKHGNFGEVETAKMDIEMLSFLRSNLGL